MTLSSSFDVLVVIVNDILGMSNLRIVQGFLIPWITGHYDTTQVMFFLDSAPAHGSRTTCIRWCCGLFFKDPWPSSSPGLGRCDYWMWGVIEADPDAVTHKSVDELKDVMKSAFSSNKVTHVKRACTSFRDCTENMVTASGGFIVQWLYLPDPSGPAGWVGPNEKVPKWKNE